MPTIGRHPGSDILVQGDQVSTHHADITPIGNGRFQLRDLGSTNGTYVNGQRVQTAVVGWADRISLGSLPFDLRTYAALLGAVPAPINARAPAPAVAPGMPDTPPGSFLIGRDPRAHIQVEAPQVSTFHARLTPLPAGKFDLVDLGSSNGTFVNGQRITTTILLPGDELRCGSHPLDLAAYQHLFSQQQATPQVPEPVIQQPRQPAPIPQPTAPIAPQGPREPAPRPQQPPAPSPEPAVPLPPHVPTSSGSRPPQQRAQWARESQPMPARRGSGVGKALFLLILLVGAGTSAYFIHDAGGFDQAITWIDEEVLGNKKQQHIRITPSSRSRSSGSSGGGVSKASSGSDRKSSSQGSRTTSSSSNNRTRNRNTTAAEDARDFATSAYEVHKAGDEMMNDPFGTAQRVATDDAYVRDLERKVDDLGDAAERVDGRMKDAEKAINNLFGGESD